jgi:hypothetical protein
VKGPRFSKKGKPVPITNRFKSSSQLRAGTKSATPRDVRRTLDDYETPPTATLALAESCDLGPKPKILEPAAGSGRMVRALQLGYHGALALYGRHKPELIILIPWRIMFIEGDGSGRPIKSQTYSHTWLIWPERGRRGANIETRVVWASQHGEIQPWQ